VEQLRQKAEATLPRAAYDYYAAGSGDEITLGEATQAWRSFRFLPSVLSDVSRVSTRTDLLGERLALPVLAAPTALHAMAHPGGERATAAGVAAAGSLMVLSSRSSVPVEEVAGHAGPWWFQVYALRDRSLTEEQVLRAAAAGARALVLTADAPYVYAKPGVTGPLPLPEGYAREVAFGTRTPDREQDPSIGPDTIGWLRALTGLPVLVKGVLRPGDAVRCADAGAAGVIVSNHGGRQLDRAVPTAYAIRGVATAVGDRIPVLVDGGVRDGRDVLTALALGATAVLLGRPVLWALAAGGADEVRDLFTGLGEELAQAMALAGVPTLDRITADLLATLP
jgi:4-hydroxymandelate oxidase